MTNTASPTKLIEVALPLDAINREAAKEKSVRNGHPSTLHVWWARRPLAACRAVLFAQLVDDPSAHPDLFPTEADQSAERERLFDIMRRLAPWEATKDAAVLEEARAEIRRCYPGGAPTVIDPFSGGGSIPLEAQRLGLEVRASDLNPVSVLITKALTELPARFVGRPPVRPDDGSRMSDMQSWKHAEGLAEDVRYYGNWMKDQAEERLGHLYPDAVLPDGGRAKVIAWLWARTVRCPNPACRATMPLVRSFWLSKKKGKQVWLEPAIEASAKRVSFRIQRGSGGPSVDATVGRGGATCLICSSPVPLDHVRAEGRAGRLGTQLMTVVAESNRQRVYVPPTDEHARAADVARPDGTPDTELPAAALGFRVQGYGMRHHADLFTNRQLHLLCTFTDLVGEARARVLEDSGGDDEYADAVATYLGLTASKVARFSITLSTWRPDETKLSRAFALQTVPMVWDFAEAQPFAGAGGDLGGLVEGTAAVLDRWSGGPPSVCVQGPAMTADFASLVVSTDPPYYDNIGYSDLSDVFYVWLRRSLRSVWPELLATVLTPKADELVVAASRFEGSADRASAHFEDGFSRTFGAMAKNARPDIPITVYYAFKQQEAESTGDEVSTASTGWEKMLEGLLRAGFSVVGTWPMRTEGATRMRGRGANALASSIVLVCRQRPADAGITDRRGFLHQLQTRLRHDLRTLQSGGIAPVDLAQAAVGPGMAVFSSFTKVVEPTGEPMSVRTALALINRVLDEASAEQEGEFDEDTRWAISWYSEYGHDDGPYGRADDLARAKNVSVDGLVRAGIVRSGAGKVRLLDREELDPEWDPSSDSRVTVWEVCQHLIRRLDDGTESAGELLARVGGLGDAARDLAYRLFQIAEAKKWAKEAGPYNALAAEWPELTRIASMGPAGQGTLL